jgi:serine/threonine-protein kinase
MSRATPAHGPEVPRSPAAGAESATLPAASAQPARQALTPEGAPAELRSGVRRSPSFREFVLGPTQRHGEVLAGRYRIEGFLARGGTADVFLARDFVEESLVVIKQIRPEAAAHPELRARFVKEGHATRAIRHPGVVRVLSVEEPDEEAPFITLEALRGESLGDYLRRRDKMPVELGLVLMRQAAAALAAVHASGVVHRDVKPDNLFLVGPPDEPSLLKLLDFGMADFGDERPSEDSTSVLGTAQYMAPEQILVEPVDARADVYGLGVVMFRMFSGHLPFEGKSPKELLLHQLFSPVPPPSWLVEDLDPRLEALILRATKKHRDNRFASMGEMMDALDALLGFRVEGASLPPCVHPDVYRPQTARGQRVARHLAVEFGPYAAVPPSTRFA